MQCFSFMFVVILIAITVFVTNMLIMKGKQDSSVTWLEDYKRTEHSNGMVTLDPYSEIKNTLIMLHDFKQTALKAS